MMALMKRSLTVLLLLLFCLSVAWWRLDDRRKRNDSSGRALNSVDSSLEPAPADETPAKPARDAPDATATTAAASPAPNTPPSPAGDDKSGPRFKRAYMLSLEKGALALVQAQDIEGDFAPRRGKEEVWSNMLRFRLMSESNAVLAEELLPAPDHVCQVLDPRSADGKAVNFTNPGPAIFQVRLPRVKGAARLDVFRIVQPGEPVVENLLGSLPLSH